MGKVLQVAAVTPEELVSPTGQEIDEAVLEELRRELRDLGGPGSGNFDHAGRPGEVGGSQEVGLGKATEEAARKMVFYHGTVDQAIESIKKSGLVPKAGRGADTWAKEMSTMGTPPPEMFTMGDRQSSVFIARSPSEARMFARYATQVNPGTQALVLKIEVPEKESHRIKEDEFSGNERFVGSIPPEWIVGRVALPSARPIPHVPTIEALTKNRVFYAVVLVKEEPEVLGGSGSGNFGHAGRPGEVGGSATAGFEPATTERRKELGLPPAWTNVLINPDRQGALQAVGTDVKGRQQYRYSAAHSAEAAAAKFERMKAFEKELPALRATIVKDMRSEDLDVREPAAVLNLIDKTGFRIGSTGETLAEKQAYGASTLEARHVKVDLDKVSFRFVGKKGVDISKTINDPELAKELRGRLEGKGRKDRLFETSDGQVRSYMNEKASDFSPKDFRTRHANAIALSIIAKGRVPKSDKEFKKARREVGEKVARYLGNTHTVALKSYINPAVFAQWEAR